MQLRGVSIVMSFESSSGGMASPRSSSSFTWKRMFFCLATHLSATDLSCVLRFTHFSRVPSLIRPQYFADARCLFFSTALYFSSMFVSCSLEVVPRFVPKKYQIGNVPSGKNREITRICPYVW